MAKIFLPVAIIIDDFSSVSSDYFNNISVFDYGVLTKTRTHDLILDEDGNIVDYGSYMIGSQINAHLLERTQK